MGNGAQYEERILKELRGLPQDALPKILRFIALLKQEFLSPEAGTRNKKSDYRKTDHRRIQKLLASSKMNWAQELIADREDRL